jgi:low affinity Fe/Cu permease
VPQKEKSKCGPFERFARTATHATGATPAFMIAVAVVVVWAATGPIFHFSDTWQLVINTGTTVVTFLMVFLIQHTQNKDSVAIQLKLDEIVAAIPGASNHLIDAEDLDMSELERLHKLHQGLADKALERVREGRGENADEDEEDDEDAVEGGAPKRAPDEAQAGVRLPERSTLGRSHRRP